MHPRTGVCLAGLLILSTACTTPGLEYSARLMPDNFATTDHRDVAVERFAGPAGGWYAGQFEAMLLQTEFDGAPWFNVTASHSDTLRLKPSGVYSGEIDVVDHDWQEYHRTVSKCIEWDGLFDCETRVDVEEICYSESVDIVVAPQLIDIDSGEIVFSGQYSGRAHEKECFETGVYDGAYNKRIKRKRAHHTAGHLGFGLGFPGFSAPAHLVREALSDTLHPIRKDIAPRNARVKARFMTTALDPVAKADVRFQQALDISRDEPLTSCALWAELANEYTDAPAVAFNNGVCAEASHKYTDAQALYAKASELTANFGDAGSSAYEMTLKQLRKLSDQRYGLEAIKALTGEAQSEPADATS